MPVVELMGYGRLVALGDRLVYLDLDLNGQPASAVGPQTRDALLADGFQYVVWRKDMLAELEHDVPDSLTPGFIASVFPPGTKPVFDDGHTVAYRLTPTTAAERTLTVAYGDGWGRPHNTGRRAYGSGQIDVERRHGGPCRTAPHRPRRGRRRAGRDRPRHRHRRSRRVAADRTGERRDGRGADRAGRR